MASKTTVEKFFNLLRNRRGHLLQTIRCYLLFYAARIERALIRLPRVVLEKNIRLQRNRSLMAESPNALIHLGAHSIIYEDTVIEAYGSGQITIGESSIIGGAKIISRQRIGIGKRFLCSWNVYIQDFDSHPVNSSLRKKQVEDMVNRFRPSFTKVSPEPSSFIWEFPGDPIDIGDDVWVGAGATILKGARIGAGSIVATGAVVLRGIYPPNSLIAGNPAIVVKNLETNTPYDLTAV